MSQGTVLIPAVIENKFIRRRVVSERTGDELNAKIPVPRILMDSGREGFLVFFFSFLILCFFVSALCPYPMGKNERPDV